MNFFWAAVLGLVQGITEFLPVSSSGHLVIVQNFISSFIQPGAFFDVILHLGTVCAVLVFFRKRLIKLIRKCLLFFIIGTIPAGLVGVLLQDQIETLFTNIKFVGIALLVTAIFNLIMDRTLSKKRKIDNKKALSIGMFQALAIIPGISRSGSTIFAGVKLGIDKKEAAEFSFLLSIPVILGANILQFVSHGVSSIVNPFYYLTGFFVAFASGFISIGIVLKALHKKQFKYFGYYCLVVGLIVLIFSR